MAEIKQRSGDELVDRYKEMIRETGSDCEKRLRNLVGSLEHEIEDAAAGLRALAEGLGSTIDRARAIFVARLTEEDCRSIGRQSAGGFSVAGARIQFPRTDCNFHLTLDEAAWHTSGDLGPKLPPANYRVLVLITPEVAVECTRCKGTGTIGDVDPAWKEPCPLCEGKGRVG